MPEAENGGSSAAEYVALTRQLIRTRGIFGALEAARKAVALDPENVQANATLAWMYASMSRETDAIEYYARALELGPPDVELLVARGDCCNTVARVEDALDDFRQALSLAQDRADLHERVGLCLCRLGRHEEGLSFYESAVRLEPESRELRARLGERYLQAARFDEGWDHYQWQAEIDVGDTPPRAIVVQGFAGNGDVIQFARLFGLFKERGHQLAFESRPGLRRLISSMSAVDEFYVNADDVPGEAPGYVGIDILAVPCYFRVDLNRVPGTAPFIAPDQELVAQWSERIDTLAQAHQHRMKVGVCWAGNPSHTNDANRSASLVDFAPLGACTGVLFFNLRQSVDFDLDMADPPAGLPLIDIASEIGDYADTAAVIANLNLVISVDTSVAHVAGAIGKPVWTLLPIDSEWRWMLDREDCPWYPSMRLFRQTRYQRWDTVIPRIAEELSNLANKADS